MKIFRGSLCVILVYFFTSMFAVIAGSIIGEISAPAYNDNSSFSVSTSDAEDGILSVNNGISVSSGTSSPDEIIDTKVITIISAVLLLVICLCTDSVVMNWSSTRRRELFVRLLVGAEPYRAISKILEDYIITALFASLLGILFGVIFCAAGLIGLDNITYPFSIFIPIAVFITGTAMCFFHLRSMLAEPVCALRRR